MPALALAACAGFFLLGYGGIMVWGGNAHSASPIWPATAFGFVMMLRLSRSRAATTLVMLAAMLLAGLCGQLLGGASRCWPSASA